MEQYSVSLLPSLYVPLYFSSSCEVWYRCGEARQAEKLKSAEVSPTAVLLV